MGGLGAVVGFGIALVLGMLVARVLPGVWDACLPDMSYRVTLTAWTLFYGFPLSVIFATKKKVFAIFWAVVFFYPLFTLMMFKTRALPPFWMRGYDDAARWIVAQFGLLFGGWGVMWLWDQLGLTSESFDWLVHFLDRIFSRKR